VLTCVSFTRPLPLRQDGGRRRSEVREEEVDPLLRERHLHHVPGGTERVRPGPGGVRQRGGWS